MNVVTLCVDPKRKFFLLLIHIHLKGKEVENNHIIHLIACIST